MFFFNDIENLIHIDLRYIFYNNIDITEENNETKLVNIGNINLAINNNHKYDKYFIPLLECKYDKVILVISVVLFTGNNYKSIEAFINYFYSLNKKILLIIDESFEGTDLSILNMYHKLLSDRFNDNFFIMSGNIKVKNLKNYIYYNIFRYSNLGYLSLNPKHNFDFYFSNKKNKLKHIDLFVSFNRVIREHRIAFAYYIQQIKFDHKYLMSLDNFKIYKHMKNFNISYEQLIKIKKPLYIDTKDFSVNRAIDMPYKFYCSTFFSHVNETLFTEDSIFLSEKIYKPIIAMHPFTVMGNPYILQELKKEGFEVNFKGINNSYDNEVNHEKRLLMIIEEIKKLNSLTKQDLLDFYYENKDILIYNRQIFLGLNERRQSDEDIIRKKIIDKFNTL